MGTGRATSRLRSRTTAWLLGALALGACEDRSDSEFREGDLVAPPRYSAVAAPLPAAHCSVDVTGIGILDLEADYLPQVIYCENNGADFEALKAQAIAARSVAYYNMETQGSICDSQGCQVFTCNGQAGEMHRQAVEATSGIYLAYNSVLTYGFYVAGDSSLTPPGCVGNDADASTEHYVTYNEGRSGTNVEQTDLGLVIDPGDPIYGQNRGCMSQWGARCLENDVGYDALQILQFYYGEDIELLQAKGPCVADDVDVPVPEPTTTGPDTSAEPETMGDGGSEPDSDSDADSDSDTRGPFGTGGGETGGTAGGGSGSDGDPGALPGGYGNRRDSSCACRSRGDGPREGGLLLLLLAPLLRRRRRSRARRP